MEEQPKSLVVFAENEIRKLILAGEVSLGQRVTEAELAARFGMSKTPVREALLHLQQEGLVHIRPRQGTFIFTLTDEQVEHLHEVRTLLESHALREAARKKKGRLVLEMTDNLARSRKLPARGRIQRYAELDMNFHRLLFTYAGNLFLDAAYRAIEIKLQVLWYLSLEVYPPGQMEYSINSHQHIAECILADDLDGACEMLREHNKFLYSPSTGRLMHYAYDA